MGKLPDWWEKVRFSKSERETAESPAPEGQGTGEMPGGEIDIGKGRTEAFLSAAKEFSDFIGALPLDREQNDRLVELAIAQTREAERGAFSFGMDVAAQILRAIAGQDGGED